MGKGKYECSRLREEHVQRLGDEKTRPFQGIGSRSVLLDMQPWVGSGLAGKLSK